MGDERQLGDIYNGKYQINDDAREMGTDRPRMADNGELNTIEMTDNRDERHLEIMTWSGG